MVLKSLCCHVLPQSHVLAASAHHCHQGLLLKTIPTAADDGLGSCHNYFALSGGYVDHHVVEEGDVVAGGESLLGPSFSLFEALSYLLIVILVTGAVATETHPVCRTVN